MLNVNDNVEGRAKIHVKDPGVGNEEVHELEDEVKSDLLFLRGSFRGSVTTMGKKRCSTRLPQKCIMKECVCSDSEISSSVGGLKPRMKDYDTGVESGDDLEEEDFSM